MCRVGKTNAARSAADVCPPAELMAGTARKAIARTHRQSWRHKARLRASATRYGPPYGF
jgi:hypothetical protein